MKYNPKLVLRIRTYPEGFAGVWIIARDGAAEQGLLFGEMIPIAADVLAEKLGLPVEREESPCVFEERQPVVTKKQLKEQADLFGEST